MNACMPKNSSTFSNNTALWYYLGTKRLDFKHENNIAPQEYQLRKYSSLNG